MTGKNFCEYDKDDWSKLSDSLGVEFSRYKKSKHQMVFNFTYLVELLTLVHLPINHQITTTHQLL